MIPGAFFALALQAAPLPDFTSDPAFTAAHAAWAGCTNRQIDAAAASSRREGEVVAAAQAACAAEEAGVRAAMIALMGRPRGPRMMDELVRADRGALVRRLRERRAGVSATASPDALIEAWVHCLVRQVDGAAAAAPEAQAVDAAFGACAAEEGALRRQAVALGGARRADEFIRRAREANRAHLLAHLRERRRR